MSKIVESYTSFMDAASDPRTQNWWMMSGPGPLFTVIISYVYFSVSVGPRYMKDKKPYDLKGVMIVYNAVQVVFSAFLMYEGLMAGWLYEYSFTCQPVDYSDSPSGKRMASAVWWYFLAKIVELLDTVFFVLRKKNNQISFLHVYHHSIMPVCAWIGVKFLPGGHATLLGVINAFIHIIMYTYYLLAGLGPQYQKLLWWKKYVTRLQLVQFMIIFVHNVQLLPRTCNYPKVIAVLLTVNASLFIYLFGSFYIKTYKKEAAQRRMAASIATSNNLPSADKLITGTETTQQPTSNGNFAKDKSNYLIEEILSSRSSTYEKSKDQ